MTPRDVAMLIDRLQVLFGRPSTTSEGHNLSATISSEPLPVDSLRRIVEATRSPGSPAADRGSGLPHLREKRPD